MNAAEKSVKRRPGRPNNASKAGPGRRPRGRIPKRGGLAARNKRRIQINGLDLLHTQTLLSTSPQGKKLPAAPGCIDQQLTTLVLPGAIPCHEEIPPSLAVTANDGTNIPYGLQVNCFSFLFSSEFHFEFSISI